MLTPSQVHEQPTVDWVAYDETDHYALLMVDPDAPSAPSAPRGSATIWGSCGARRTSWGARRRVSWPLWGPPWRASRAPWVSSGPRWRASAGRSPGRRGEEGEGRAVMHGTP